MPHDRPPHLLPPWCQRELSALGNRLDGTHAKADGSAVFVCAAALCGEDGFSLDSGAESNNMDPSFYGPVMIEALNMLAGEALGQIMANVDAQLDNPDDAIQQIEDADERREAIVRRYETAIRQFLRQTMTYAGQQFQAGKGFTDGQPPDDSLVAGSHVLATVQTLAQSPWSFRAPNAPEAPETPTDPETPE